MVILVQKKYKVLSFVSPEMGVFKRASKVLTHRPALRRERSGAVLTKRPSTATAAGPAGTSRRSVEMTRKEMLQLSKDGRADVVRAEVDDIVHDPNLTMSHKLRQIARALNHADGHSKLPKPKCHWFESRKGNSISSKEVVEVLLDLAKNYTPSKAENAWKWLDAKAQFNAKHKDAAKKPIAVIKRDICDAALNVFESQCQTEVTVELAPGTAAFKTADSASRKWIEKHLGKTSSKALPKLAKRCKVPDDQPEMGGVKGRQLPLEFIPHILILSKTEEGCESLRNYGLPTEAQLQSMVTRYEAMSSAEKAAVNETATKDDITQPCYDGCNPAKTGAISTAFLHAYRLHQYRTMPRDELVQHDLKLWSNAMKTAPRTQKEQLVRQLILLHHGMQFRTHKDREYQQWDMPIISALSHGGRTKCVSTQHSQESYDRFIDWLKGPDAKARKFNSHGVRSDGREEKSNRQVLNFNGDGINFPFSTVGVDTNGHHINRADDGYHMETSNGHILITRDLHGGTGYTLMGYENSEPQAPDQWGGTHSIDCSVSDMTPLGGPKWKEIRGGDVPGSVDCMTVDLDASVTYAQHTDRDLADHLKYVEEAVWVRLESGELTLDELMGYNLAKDRKKSPIHDLLHPTAPDTASVATIVSDVAPSDSGLGEGSDAGSYVGGHDTRAIRIKHVDTDIDMTAVSTRLELGKDDGGIEDGTSDV